LINQGVALVPKLFGAKPFGAKPLGLIVALAGPAVWLGFGIRMLRRLSRNRYVASPDIGERNPRSSSL
jgi:hypothetical protein